MLWYSGRSSCQLVTQVLGALSLFGGSGDGHFLHDAGVGGLLHAATLALGFECC